LRPQPQVAMFKKFEPANRAAALMHDAVARFAGSDFLSNL